MIPQTLVSLIGLAAAFVTTVCWVPQAWRIIRTRDTQAISLGDAPLILANTITLALQLTIVGLKLRYG